MFDLEQLRLTSGAKPHKLEAVCHQPMANDTSTSWAWSIVDGNEGNLKLLDQNLERVPNCGKVAIVMPGVICSLLIKFNH